MRKGNIFYSLLIAFLFLTSFVCVNVISSQSLQSYAKIVEYINGATVNIPLTPMVGGGEITQYTVSFDTGDGDSLSAITANQNSSIQLPAATKTGYLFEGWATTSGGAKAYDAEENYTITNNVTLFALWILNEYTITFVANGGTQTSAITQAYNSTLELPTPTREGYTFAGWYLDETLETIAELETMGASDITLYASWTKQESASNVALFVILGVCLVALATVLPIIIIRTRKNKQKPEQK